MTLELLLLSCALVLLAAVVVAKLGDRIGLPALLLFLALGVSIQVVGAQTGSFNFTDGQMAHDLGFVALVLILIEGGFSTHWDDIKPAITPSVLLASAGVLLGIVVQATFGFLVLGLPIAMAVLVAAIMTPTDSAAVFSVLRHVPVPAKLRSVLEGESGLNDAPAVLLTITATHLAMGEEAFDLGLLVKGAEIIGELVGGMALGFVVGWIGVRILRQVALPSSGLYPLAAMGWAIMAYGLGGLVHVSGFAAVYVCAVVLGNGKLPHRHATKSFAEGVGWTAQIGLFVMLGLLSDVTRITAVDVVIGVGGGLFLTFVVRPLTVFVCTAGADLGKREKLFLSWGGLRGAVPIILATIPMYLGLSTRQANSIFDLTFVAVIVLTVLNGPTLPWVAKKLGLVGEPDESDIEVAPLERIEAVMVQIAVAPDSKLHGVAVRELRLPANTTVSLIIRGGQMFAPHGRDQIKSGDQLLIVTPAAQRAAVERRLKLIGRAGRLASWTEEGRRWLGLTS
ncbi:MAG: potassium/proton antiporter [Propionibacteriaceae bacterium]|jgi:cell volume regulation protein A|nr:potassium/proton antiporter [Propionibacteriaceae bacterium]